MKNIKEIAYERYQLDWMSRHGYGIRDIYSALLEMEKESPEAVVGELIDSWELDCGFGGEIWVCYKEFLENEFMDKEYMKNILDSEKYELYLKEM